MLELFGLSAEPIGDGPDGDAGAILALLADGSASTDELVRRSGLAPEVVAAALVELELAGLASTADGLARAMPR